VKYVLFFPDFEHYFIIYIDVLQLPTRQPMTLQIRSHIEYLTHLKYSCAHFILKLDEKSCPY